MKRLCPHQKCIAFKGVLGMGHGSAQWTLGADVPTHMQQVLLAAHRCLPSLPPAWPADHAACEITLMLFQPARSRVLIQLKKSFFFSKWSSCWPKPIKQHSHQQVWENYSVLQRKQSVTSVLVHLLTCFVQTQPLQQGWVLHHLVNLKLTPSFRWKKAISGKSPVALAKLSLYFAFLSAQLCKLRFTLWLHSLVLRQRKYHSSCVLWSGAKCRRQRTPGSACSIAVVSAGVSQCLPLKEARDVKPRSQPLMVIVKDPLSLSVNARLSISVSWLDSASDNYSLST